MHLARLGDHGLVARRNQCPAPFGDRGAVLVQPRDIGICRFEDAVDVRPAIGVFVNLRIHGASPCEAHDRPSRAVNLPGHISGKVPPFDRIKFGGLKIGARNVSPIANPSSPSRAPRNAPLPKAHRYIDASFTDNFGRQSKLTTASANGFARKKLDAAAQSLQLKSERREKQLRRIEIREWRAAERSVAAEQRESEHRIRLMWRSLKTKVRPEKKVRYTPPKDRKRHWPYAAVALPKYNGPVIDRQGQRGVFMRMRYYSRRTAEQGVSQRVVKYCFNGAELDLDGNPYVATNVGATIDEAICGFDHLEQVNWSAAKNAKLMMHGILAVHHRQSPDEMMTVGVRWAEETLGRFDLPYLVTLHAPPSDGDQRNWHLHILWSYRPLVRTGDHEWQVGKMLRTDIDNPAAMKLFREMFAAVMTDVSFETGQNQVWTARSNADRGLPHEPQAHLGAARTNRARSGEHVAENEENHERFMRSKAAVIDDALRHADEALAKVQDAAHAIAARFARLPTLPMRVPERVVAAAMVLDTPSFGKGPPLSKTTVAAPEMPPYARIEPAIIGGTIERWGRQLPRRSSVEAVVSAAPQRIPRPAPVEIANLRIRALRLTNASIVPIIAVPARPARPSIPVLSILPTLAPLRLVNAKDRAEPPHIMARPAFPQLPALAPLRLPSVADITLIDRAIARTDDARKRDEERRKREDQAIARIAREARAVAAHAVIQRQALDDGAASEKPRKHAWQLARDQREQAMAGWTEAERLDGAGPELPGRQLPRPSTGQNATKPVAARMFPGLPGHGISD